MLAHFNRPVNRIGLYFEMKFIYRLKKGYCNALCHDAWGIEAVSEDGQTVLVENVFPDRDRAEKFVSLCNTLSLDPVHLYEVLEDELSFFEG